MYDGITFRTIEKPLVDVAATTAYILRVQKANGEIPWSRGGKTDHWDHVESAMGLTVGGFYREAKKAYMWSAENQIKDGSWWSSYRRGGPEFGAFKDTNMTAYIAVGVLHYFMATGDNQFVNAMWHTVSKAMDFVIDLQCESGEIYWAKRSDGSIDKKALLTGSSSIFLSLTCALQIASMLGERRPRWEVARKKLGDAIRNKSDLFDQSKSRFAMDWYYPILSGALQGKAAQRRIEDEWDKFAIPGWGVRCVSDRPWVTMAETAELCISLAAMGNISLAETILGWISDKKYEEGAFWTGLTVPDRIIYTEEKTAWTGAAVLLAADLIYDLSPASRFFGHGYVKPFSVYSREEKRAVS